MVGGGIGTLGAAPLSSPSVEKQEEKKEEHNKNFHDVMQREGLYDVLAPSGALGIVVDTTKDGPAVHSLKQTSPMLGLINPGDLIVGLDSNDTRSMTAATLTRLMASKSRQNERKITLLAGDNY
jgi:C-terminal processing protease CtpA/Prc